MDKPLTFIATPFVTIGTNRFLCRIPIRYKDIPVLEIIQDLTTFNEETFITKIPIFHSDGTKLAIVKGRRIFLTNEGEKAGVKLRHLPDGDVCEIDRKLAFEIRRKGSAALKMTAELHTFDGAFLRYSEEELFGQLMGGNDIRKLKTPFTNCEFQGEVGIQIGTPTKPLPTCVGLNIN